MGKNSCYIVTFECQVAEEFIVGETLHALSKCHDISRRLDDSIAFRIEGDDANLCPIAGRPTSGLRITLPCVLVDHVAGGKAWGHPDRHVAVPG